ncbi:MAG: hypothetical protein R3A52_05410 [Polyangiales bacterium]
MNPPSTARWLLSALGCAVEPFDELVTAREGDAATREQADELAWSRWIVAMPDETLFLVGREAQRRPARRGLVPVAYSRSTTLWRGEDGGLRESDDVGVELGLAESTLLSTWLLRRAARVIAERFPLRAWSSSWEEALRRNPDARRCDEVSDAITEVWLVERFESSEFGRELGEPGHWEADRVIMRDTCSGDVWVVDTTESWRWRSRDAGLPRDERLRAWARDSARSASVTRDHALLLALLEDCRCEVAWFEDHATDAAAVRYVVEASNGASDWSPVSHERAWGGCVIALPTGTVVRCRLRAPSKDKDPSLIDGGYRGSLPFWLDVRGSSVAVPRQTQDLDVEAGSFLAWITSLAIHAYTARWGPGSSEEGREGSEVGDEAARSTQHGAVLVAELSDAMTELWVGPTWITRRERSL